MNLSEWRAAVREQAGRLRTRLSTLVRQTEQLAPRVIYGTTAGLTVLPLVAAAHNGAVPYGELATLLGSMGVNLLSNELHAWKQRSEAELEEDLPAHLGRLAQQNTEWREVLDKLIEATHADAAVQTALGEDAAPYVVALQQDAARLGSRLIIANSTNVKYAVVGDGNTITEITHIHNGPSLPLDFDDILHAYLVNERRLCDELPLAKPKIDARRVPRMQRVFVELRTTLPVDETTWFDRLGVPATNREQLRHEIWLMTQEKGKDKATAQGASKTERLRYADLHRLDDDRLARVATLLGVTPNQLRGARHPLTPLEYLHLLRIKKQPAHLLLLGEPGGGKSTWVRRLMSLLAWQRLAAYGEALEQLTEEECDWLTTAQAAFGTLERGHTPIRIPLHRWASMAHKGEVRLAGTAADLVAICTHFLQLAHAAESLSISDHALGLLKRGGAVILLDGLDEVPDIAQRPLLIAAVQAFAASYPQTPLLITCRSKPYARLVERGQAVLRDTHVCTLGPLDDDAILRFVERWYAEMIWAERGDKTKLLIDARRLQIALPTRPELWHMAGTPLLLTMMARTNEESGLPDGRAELYENLVKELLWEWEVRRTYGEGAQPYYGLAAPTDERSLVDILSAASPDLRQAHLEQALNRLAYTIHCGGNEAVEIERETLEKWMRTLLPHATDDARTKAKATELATEVVNFIGRRTGLLVEIDIKDGGESQRFRFTHRTFQEYLAARWMATGNYDARRQKIQGKLADVNWRESIFLAIGCLLSPINNAYDEGLILIERLLHGDPQNETEWYCQLLVSEAFVRQFTPQKLALATDAYARKETLRSVSSRLLQAMQAHTQSATDRMDAGLLLDDLRDQHNLDPNGLYDIVAVPGTNFGISKYPVTNRQFQRFIEAGGYGKRYGQCPGWWSAEGWRHRRNNDWTAPRYWDDRRFNRASQPVVGMSWYEAEAYCRWLNHVQSVPAGYEVRLPTKEQWVLAARNGNREAPNERVDYPWARGFVAALANTKESGLGRTTPVDMYPNGATPAGVYDLVGNVWEWGSYEFNYDHSSCMLYGGSWSNDAKSIGCSTTKYAWHRDYSSGCRVVVIPTRP